jgi:uncharacterized membrane protein
VIKEKLSKKNWFIITLFSFMGGIICLFALIPLYFLVKKGIDKEERVA